MASTAHIQQCLSRACEAFDRKPTAALQPDSPAVAIWRGGLGASVPHPALPALATDMPAALGGEGIAPSPGWFFRAGVASCMVTSIALQAARRGIDLTRLEVEARSESDARGMLGTSADIPAGPLRFSLQVTLEADGVPQAQLRELLRDADEHAPMSSALRRTIAIDVELRLGQPAPAGA